MGRIFPSSFKEFLDPAGIFHEGGLLGADLFGLDKTSEKAAAIVEQQRQQSEALARQEAYNKGLEESETAAYVKYRAAGLDAETAASEAVTAAETKQMTNNGVKIVIILAVLAAGYFMINKFT